jgi:DNA-binding NarL/FixJ family response regulator
MNCCIYCKLNIKPTEFILFPDIIDGKEDKYMARKHDIPLHVVKYRMRTLFDKLDVMNRTQAATKLQKISL